MQSFFSLQALTMMSFEVQEHAQLVLDMICTLLQCVIKFSPCPSYSSSPSSFALQQGTKSEEDEDQVFRSLRDVHLSILLLPWMECLSDDVRYAIICVFELLADPRVRHVQPAPTADELAHVINHGVQDPSVAVRKAALSLALCTRHTTTALSLSSVSLLLRDIDLETDDEVIQMLLQLDDDTTSYVEQVVPSFSRLHLEDLQQNTRYDKRLETAFLTVKDELDACERGDKLLNMPLDCC